MMTARLTGWGVLTVILSLLAGPGCRPVPTEQEVVVFGASSLSGVFREIKPAFEAQYPEFALVFEPSGSQVAVRKITELGRRADLVTVADWRLLDGPFVPKRADWLVQFAADELVLAYAEHSPFAEQIAPANWRKLLLNPKVRLGRASERTAPLGYHTLLSWQLAGLHFLGDADRLARQLEARCSPENVTTDAEQLVALLAARVIDYAFVYRSLAEGHRLRAVRLPPELNLGSSALGEWYEKAHIEVAQARPGPAQSIRGSAILFGLTIPRDAPNRRGAESLAAFVTGFTGQSLLQRAAFAPLRPARARGPGLVPAVLAAHLKQATEP